jgi:hypothetical protein
LAQKGQNLKDRIAVRFEEVNVDDINYGSKKGKFKETKVALLFYNIGDP